MPRGQPTHEQQITPISFYAATKKANELMAPTYSHRQNRPAQPGDVIDTYADTAELQASVDYQPQTSVMDGVAQFVRWFRANRF